MNKLILHIGTRKTATTSIQGALRINDERLTNAGIYVPRAGQSDLSDATTCHHNLAWEILDDRRFASQGGGWAELAAELRTVQPKTVLISSESLDRLFLVPRQAQRFLGSVHGLGYKVVVVVVMRDCLEYLNSMYAQMVKMFVTADSFDDYVQVMLQRGDVNVFDKYQPLIEDRDVDFRLATYQSITDGDPLANLLRFAGVDPPADLAPPTGRLNLSLGATGVEITRHLNRYLTARFPDFAWNSQAGRLLHRASAKRLKRRGLSGTSFWGYDRALAHKVAAGVRSQHDSLSQCVWGTPWPYEFTIDRQKNVATFDDFDPRATRATVAHVRDMARRFEKLHTEHPR